MLAADHMRPRAELLVVVVKYDGVRRAAAVVHIHIKMASLVNQLVCLAVAHTVCQRIKDFLCDLEQMIISAASPFRSVSSARFIIAGLPAIALLKLHLVHLLG